MKTFTKFAFALAAFMTLAACSSDRSPVDFINTDPASKEARTLIQLTFNPSSTRAAISEDAISLVHIYVFDAGTSSNVHLEKIIPNLEVKSNSLMLDLDVEAGKKTIYAITAKNVFDSVDESISLYDFESKIFSTENLKTDSELVMTGKQENVEIKKTTSIINIPQSNLIQIELERLSAKIDVLRASSLTENGFGFSVSSVDFKICQTRNEMRLSRDAFTSFEDSDDDGTYDCYDTNKKGAYSSVVTSSSNIQYIAENLVDKSVSGNTTFINLRVKLSPTNWYSVDSTTGTTLPQLSTASFSDLGSFFVIGVYDSKNGNLIEYVKTNDKIACFINSALAERFIDYGDYMGADKPAALPEGFVYKVIEFKDCYAYYRINISNGNGNYGVERNTHYRVKVNKLSALGASAENDLFPTSANSDLENVASAFTMSESSFEIKKWSEINDDVDL